MTDKKENSLFGNILLILLFTIMGLAVIAPIIMGIYEFWSASDDFTTPFVLYAGMSGLLLTLLWIGLGGVLFFCVKMRFEYIGMIISAIFYMVIWFGVYALYEEPLTKYYVATVINQDQKKYEYCGYQYKTQSKEQYSKIFVFAKADVGCEPYEQLGLRKLDTQKARNAIDELNRKFRKD